MPMISSYLYNILSPRNCTLDFYMHEKASHRKVYNYLLVQCHLSPI